MITNKFLFTLLFALACSSTVLAQDDAFNLSSQRGEKQANHMGDRKKIDHQGIVYPDFLYNFVQ